MARSNEIVMSFSNFLLHIFLNCVRACCWPFRDEKIDASTAKEEILYSNRTTCVRLCILMVYMQLLTVFQKRQVLRS